MKAKKAFVYFLMALAGGIIAVFVYIALDNSPDNNVTNSPRDLIWEANFPDDFDPGDINFTYAAERTVHGVVHVKTIREREERQILDPFDFFFGPREREEDPEPETGFGSGVIVTGDGYIVTNYHVIHDADEIEVTLHDQRTFAVEVRGTDPNTDIAILKIDANDLHYIGFGSSDDLRLGEWVLAVGNPFGLTSSVTAGIVSAKERTLGVIQEGQMPVESFLQTDAAVNLGNSGGALVNLKGELVGIPTLLISPTRTHIGTAFAVPSSIVKRVKEDIIEFGEVKRGVLGVSIREVTSELVSEKGLDQIEGVYVESTVDGSAADQAGIQRGDVILKINGNTVNSLGELQQEIGRHRPGDNVDIEIKRNDRSTVVTAELVSMERQNELLQQQEESLLGGTFKMAPEDLLKQFNLPGGIQIIDLESGILESAGVREGFIIVAINNYPVREPSEIVRLLEDYSGGVYMEGIYPDGTTAVYTFSL